MTLRLLSVIGTLSPTYGGPVEALRQFAGVVETTGCLHITVTLDSPDEPWIAQFPGRVIALGPSSRRYRFSAKLKRWLREHIEEFDAVIVRGIWQYQGLAVRSVAREFHIPYFVFVHGALDPWFKQHYPLKQLKKWLYWPWAEYRVLRDATSVLFTSAAEKTLARQSFWLYRVKEAVVDYGIGTPPGDACAQRETFVARFPELRGKRVCLFLSRLHAKKGCDLLLEAFATICSRDTTLHLVVAGPDQDGWLDRLKEMVVSLGIDHRITWTGMLSGDMKWGAYRTAEVFVLPSHSENFGIVVAEALACGLPVLITDKVNIWREVQNDGAGFVANDDLSGVISLFERWINLAPDERAAVSANASTCFEQHFGIRRSVETVIDVIKRSCGHG